MELSRLDGPSEHAPPWRPHGRRSDGRSAGYSEPGRGVSSGDSPPEQTASLAAPLEGRPRARSGWRVAPSPGTSAARPFQAPVTGAALGAWRGAWGGAPGAGPVDFRA